MALMGFSLILMPHCQSLSQLFSLAAINGFSIGSFDTAINVWLLEIWGTESGPYMQALHFAYGLGSFVAPLICEPFLSSKIMVGHHFNKVSELTTMGDNTSANALAANDSVFNTSDYITDNQIRANPIVIYIPYALAGALSIAGAINVLILFIYKRYEPPAKQSNTEHENKDLIQSIIHIQNITLLQLRARKTNLISFVSHISQQTKSLRR
jgi:fucose permease